MTIYFFYRITHLVSCFNTLLFSSCVINRKNNVEPLLMLFEAQIQISLLKNLPIAQDFQQL